jgi:4-amino-4-deoxy-L-arabinose transferase-like glycosyltransferase
MCFAPRALVWQQRRVLCTDGVFFVERAQGWESGDAGQALDRLDWNLYPLLLWGGHAGGMSWEAAGALIGLTAATLLVLPLFGIVRRTSGTLTAAVACLLYAVHPEAIDWSGEVVRDPLFWLVLVCGWGCLERAWPLGTRGWYLAAGVCVAAGVLLRFEGWFLLAVGGLVAGHGLKDASSTSVGLASAHFAKCYVQRVACLVGPLAMAMLLLNVRLLESDQPWRWGRFDHLTLARDWLAGSQVEVAAASEKPAALSAQTAGASIRELMWGYRHTLLQAFGGPYAALTVIGLSLQWVHRRWKRFWISNLLATLFLASIWVYLCRQQETTARYFVPVVILLLPAAATGLIQTCTGIAAAAQRIMRYRGRVEPRELATVGAPLLLAVVSLLLAWTGMRDSLEREYSSRVLRADLGLWIAAQFGTQRDLLCSENLERLVGHYARAQHRSIPPQLTGASLQAWVTNHPAELLVLWQRPPLDRQASDLLAAAEPLGYQRVAPRHIPQALRDAAILVRKADDGWAQVTHPRGPASDRGPR